MLTGLLAGLLVFAFARWIGEPYVERAINFESKLEIAKGQQPEPEMVSRGIQRGLGLLTGLVAYGTALGGFFGLTFAYIRGRLSSARPRVLSILLAIVGFITIVVAPFLKYPADPPAVGNPDTIGIRTAAYFLLIGLSLTISVLSVKVSRVLRSRLGDWNAMISAIFFYILLTTICARLLPVIDEVPAEFPASLLWKFRIASLAIQGALWSGLGLIFGWLTERAERSAFGL
jgi:hypothetical protein